jgi:hypothetical protein
VGCLNATILHVCENSFTKNPPMNTSDQPIIPIDASSDTSAVHVPTVPSPRSIYDATQPDNLSNPAEIQISVADTQLLEVNPPSAGAPRNGDMGVQHAAANSESDDTSVVESAESATPQPNLDGAGNVEVLTLTDDAPAVRALGVPPGERVKVTFYSLKPDWEAAFQRSMKRVHQGSRQAKIRKAFPEAFDHQPSFWLPARSVQDIVINLAGLEGDVMISTCASNFYGAEGWMLGVKACIANIDGKNKIVELELLKGSLRTASGGVRPAGVRVSRLALALQGFEARLAQHRVQQPTGAPAVEDQAADVATRHEQAHAVVVSAEEVSSSTPANGATA